MEKEIIKQLLEQLNDFKKDQLILLIVVFFVFLIINILQAVYTSRLVDKYRNELKKKEMKFSIFNELQINKLSSLFDLASDLKAGSAIIYNRINNSNEQPLELEKWKNSYEEFDLFYSSNKYIIPKSIKELVSENQKRLGDFNLNIIFYNEKLEIENSSENEISDNHESLSLINKHIISYDFKKESLEIMLFSEKIKVIIEEYFEKLE
ncbi:conserved hypothetical protein [Tenacibaculum sp. 190524A05c]|uniref:hypothetical protein n=1 Tax=Tenacibaculum platacis TaxID=3137852 RepID=UPI0031FA731B